MIGLLKGITPGELEGRYEIRTETSDGGPYHINGDGITEIKDGRTWRKDEKGLVWESQFTVAGRNTVRLETTLDPSGADEDTFIKDSKNNLTREPVTYRGELVARQENGRLVLSGEIRHGIVTTRVTMKKI